MRYETESIQPGGVLLDTSTQPVSAGPVVMGEAAMPETRLGERMTPIADEDTPASRHTGG